VVLSGAVTGVTAPLTLGTDLKIDDDGSITFNDVVIAAFSTTEGKTVEILAANSGTALTLPANITGFGTVTVANNGSHATAAITTATTSVGTLNNILGAKGKITASGTISVGAAAPLTVPENTALTLSSTLTVTGGTLTLSLTGSGNGTISGTITTSGTGIINLGSIASLPGTTISNGAGGTIQTANATMLGTLLDGASVTAGTIEVTGSFPLAGAHTLKTNVTLKVKANETLNVSGSLDVTSGATITADNSQTSGTITGNVTQDVEGISISGPDTTDLLTRTSVKKDLTTGTTNGFVTIKLGGSVGKTIPNTAAPDDIYDILFSGGADPTTVLIPSAATTGYSAVRITGLFVDGTDGTGKITQYNQAFNMWNNGVLQFINGTYGTTGVYKERSDYTGLSSTEVFDIALWNGWVITDRIIKLEITQPVSGTKRTFLIDFQNVTFQ
jgi:hypothetical protein